MEIVKEEPIFGFMIVMEEKIKIGSGTFNCNFKLLQINYCHIYLPTLNEILVFFHSIETISSTG